MKTLLSLAFLALLSAWLAVPAEAHNGFGFRQGFNGGCNQQFFGFNGGYQQQFAFVQPFNYGFAQPVFAQQFGFGHPVLGFNQFNNGFAFRNNFNFGRQRVFIQQPFRRGFSLNFFR